MKRQVRINRINGIWLEYNDALTATSLLED
jgi:hypothetical protein